MKSQLSILALVLLATGSVKGQGSYEKSFASLSPYEKRWIMMHPAAAVKVKRLTKEALKIVDSVKKAGTLDQFESGGRLDAFRHIYTMAYLARSVNVRKLRSLGLAHERGNYWQFKNGMLENGEPADSLSGEMDIRNNEIGFVTGKKYRNVSADSLKSIVINLIKEGEAWYLLRNQKGNYITCDGTEINLNEWKGKWFVPKCLAKSE